MVTGQGPTLLEQLARGASGVATVAKSSVTNSQCQ